MRLAVWGLWRKLMGGWGAALERPLAVSRRASPSTSRTKAGPPEPTRENQSLLVHPGQWIKSFSFPKINHIYLTIHQYWSMYSIKGPARRSHRALSPMCLGEHDVRRFQECNGATERKRWELASWHSRLSCRLLDPLSVQLPANVPAEGSNWWSICCTPVLHEGDLDAVSRFLLLPGPVLVIVAIWAVNQ